MNRLLTVAAVVCLTACQVTSKKPDANSPPDNSSPKLIRPVVKRIWVKPQILDNGKVYLDGYWRYEVEQNSTWAR